MSRKVFVEHIFCVVLQHNFRVQCRTQLFQILKGFAALARVELQP